MSNVLPFPKRDIEKARRADNLNRITLTNPDEWGEVYMRDGVVFERFAGGVERHLTPDEADDLAADLIKAARRAREKRP